MPPTHREPDFGRLLTVLRRKGEPDCVPFIELLWDVEVMEAVMGRPLPAAGAESMRFRVEFALKLGYDFVLARHSFVLPGAEVLQARNTAEQAGGDRSWRNEHRGPIQTWEDFERYPWPEVRDEHLADVDAVAAMLPEGMMALSILPGGVLENLTDLMGYERLCFALAEQPDLVKAVADEVGRRELALYERLCQLDHVGALWLNDDLGFKTQTMIGPRHLHEYVFPWHKRLVEYAHAHGRPVMLHACGNLAEVMEDLIENVGIDAKHSFEDVIQPVAEFKRQYGDRVAALGGVDVDLLARGTEAEVRAYTRRVIGECAPGGGWALGTGNSVANYIPPGNYLAMLDEGRQSGVYSR